MGSFRKRLLVLIIGLVVVTQTVTLAAVLASTAHNVEARAAEQLRSGRLVCTAAHPFPRRPARQRRRACWRRTSVSGKPWRAATFPRFFRRPRNNAQRIGADIVLLLDTRGRLIASTGPEVIARGLSLGDGCLSDVERQRDQPSFMVFGDQPYQFFLAPVRTPETIAWVAMGFVVDDSLAQRIHDLVGRRSQLSWRTARSGSAPHRRQSRACAARRSSPRTSSRCSRAPHPVSCKLGRHGVPELRAAARRARRLRRCHRAEADAARCSRLIVTYGTRCLVIDGIALALAAVIGTLLGRSATRPIGELVLAARRIQQGHYNTAVQVSGGDEFRSLAATFNAMQRNIAEREARHHSSGLS